MLKRSKRAKEFKRRLPKLKALDGFERRVVTRPEEIVGAFDRFHALHGKRWAAQGGSDAMGAPAVTAFHRDVVVRLARAHLVRFEELWIGGECRATLYALGGGDRFYKYQIGYDQAWAKQSVGFMLVAFSIEDAVNRGVKLYDFLRGPETYKFDWASGVQHTMTVRVVGRNSPAGLYVAREQLARAAQLAVQALLPPRAVDYLRRLRRTHKRQQGSDAGVVNPGQPQEANSTPPCLTNKP